MAQLTGLVKATRYEVESQILKRIEGTLNQHTAEQPDANTIKSEIYEYVQSKIQSLVGTYNSRFKSVHEYLEGHTERLRTLGETKTDLDV